MQRMQNYKVHKLTDRITARYWQESQDWYHRM